MFTGNYSFKTLHWHLNNVKNPLRRKRKNTSPVIIKEILKRNTRNVWPYVRFDPFLLISIANSFTNKKKRERIIQKINFKEEIVHICFKFKWKTINSTYVLHMFKVNIRFSIR